LLSAGLGHQPIHSAFHRRPFPGIAFVVTSIRKSALGRLQSPPTQYRQNRLKDFSHHWHGHGIAKLFIDTLGRSCSLKPSGNPIRRRHSSGWSRRICPSIKYIPVFAPIPPPNAERVIAWPFGLYTRSPCPPFPTVPIRSVRFSFARVSFSFNRKSVRSMIRSEAWGRPWVIKYPPPPHPRRLVQGMENPQFRALFENRQNKPVPFFEPLHNGRH